MNAKGVQEVLYEGVGAGEKDYFRARLKIKASGADLVYWAACTRGRLNRAADARPGVNAVLMAATASPPTSSPPSAGPASKAR